jgi:putative inorganic carbon (HCO3(-)) transporter
MFFVVVRLIRSGDQLRRVLVAVMVSSLIPIAVALYGALKGGFAEQKGDFSRITSTFQQSNGFSRYIMLIVIVSVALYRHVSPRARLPLAALMACSSISLLLTYTRSAWLATAAALFAIGLLQSRRIVVGLVVTAMALFVTVPSISGRFADLVSDTDTEIPGETHGNSLAWRFAYWTEDVLPLARENPITGIGLKNTPIATEEAKEPHNDFLRAYVETGLVGLAAYLGLIAALIRTARRALRHARPGLDRGVAVGFTGCVVAFVLVSVVANVMSQVVFLWYFFALAAAAEAVARRGEAVEPPPSDEVAAMPVAMAAV